MRFQNIDVDTVKTWLDDGKAVLIDVREPYEHAESCIDCAILEPLSSFNSNTIAQNSNKKIVIHCRSGKRSQEACLKLAHAHPYLDIYNLNGGIMAWEEAGHAVKKSTATEHHF